MNKNILNNIQNPGDLWNTYCVRLTEHRQKRLLQAAKNKTKYIRLILQDIHHPHNVSACLRSAEAFGLLYIDIVNLHEKFEPTSVAKGVEKWLNITTYDSITTCANTIKQQGYLIAAAFPDQHLIHLDELPINRKIAVLFGNEHDGINDNWDPHIDIKFTIPMFGLVESLNISVSCAITIRELTKKAKDLLAKEEYYITEKEVLALLDQWILKTIKH